MLKLTNSHINEFEIKEASYCLNELRMYMADN